MENLIQTSEELKESWVIRRIKKYQVITFTFGFLLLNQFTMIMVTYFSDKDLFIERFGLNIWFWAIGIPIVYFIQWLLVVWVTSKFTQETLKQKFSRHPVATITLFILYVTDLPYRLSEYRSGIVAVFETIVYYAFVSFLWWLLICWISSKIFKNQYFQWNWYKKIIEKVFVFMPIAYKIILGLIVAFVLFFVLFILVTVVFKYSGQDLKMLFS